MAPVIDARLAVSLLEVGRGPEGSVYAQRAVSNGASGVDLEWAQGVLDGTLPEGRGRVTDFTIAVVLPTGGPPALAEYAQEVAEGIEVAVATVLDSTYAVSVVTRDDEGDPGLSAQAVSELEAEGVVGIVGFLQDESLASAGSARSATVPLVSPTARNAAGAGEAVYSLEGADIQGARTVARYGASRAFQRIAMLYPNTPTAQAEAEAFREQAEALGMPVVGSFTYEAGATFFETQILGARDALRGDELAALALAREDTLSQDTLRMEVLEPTALFIPIPPEDVEFLAPQVIHFGLDTLAVEILGTAGWTDPQTLAVVEPRLTNGVVATAAVDAGAGSPGEARFRDAYESRYQRTLVGSTAAIGYDAALLLLEALRPGRVESEQLRASFEALADVEGATGLYSVVDGRVVRRTRLVRIEDRTSVPMEVR
jgi:ABC-type branched-subunit amino acid transport system substrate-binding protein